MTEFTMPSLGADMDEGVLQEWLVSPGDRVRKGDVVAVVETDKAAIEVECFDSGTVGRLLVPSGTRVPVGTPLAVIEEGGAPGKQVSPAAAEKAAEAPNGTRPGHPLVPGPNSSRLPTTHVCGPTVRPSASRRRSWGRSARGPGRSRPSIPQPRRTGSRTHR
ncbi:biotin/lipoyl-containing protein [Streptomyces sp. NPDC056255]|uniref:biotin/lipoyl-containing protein n=1 Tax=Streptomyces sp. NPDC056255 TaxID=3345764 RepID=UPI0035DDF558